MTQHEYVFVAISIILGLAITRLLHTVAMLIRVHRRVSFHWSTALWGLCVLAYVLQFWWVGWGLRDLESWHFGDFVVLIVGAICVYGAAEMALPVPEGSGNLDFLVHSESLGRLSCLSMLLYFLVGPYVNVTMFGNPVIPSLVFPVIGIALTGMMIAVPRFFAGLAVVFAAYSALILSLTA
ncbi:hypothetical protein E2F43_18185 [Seongchinamella unica]|uniref:Uncharacterized protein n=1 Tax=Seongchinamella unica TaxID=2547392 RepID=A0A4R5LN56_9GAMM|nr:hypothetical protein [Seongchinamella unica]TDG11641.1 hypothetical protein E2F43_18185 [Seongchinamella unica]